jgi:hypothetical protein
MRHHLTHDVLEFVLVGINALAAPASTTGSAVPIAILVATFGFIAICSLARGAPVLFLFAFLGLVLAFHGVLLAIATLTATADRRRFRGGIMVQSLADLASGRAPMAPPIWTSSRRAIDAGVP